MAPPALDGPVLERPPGELPEPTGLRLKLLGEVRADVVADLGEDHRGGEGVAHRLDQLLADVGPDPTRGAGVQRTLRDPARERREAALVRARVDLDVELRGRESR